MKRACLTVLLLAAASAAAWSTTVYKWVDDAGVVHFSDTPRPGAEKLEIGDAQTYAAPAATLAATAPVSTTRRAAPTSCAIDSPTSDQVFTDVSTVSGHASIAPALKPGETATMTMDGTEYPLGRDGSFQLSVERGSHTVAVKITGADGGVRCRSAVTFHVRDQSIIAPTAPAAPGVDNPNRPRP
jgi:hypothetical protein